MIATLSLSKIIPGNRAMRSDSSLLPWIPLLIGLSGCRQANDDPAAAAPLKTAAAAVSRSESAFEPTMANPGPAPAEAPEGMVWVPGGEFSMGAADPRSLPYGGPDAMADARPIHRVYVDGFWMDRTEVTNRQFAAFVDATGYVTVAERQPRAEDFPDAPPENLVPGSVVFTPPPVSVPLDDHLRWWEYIPGACWKHPSGPDDTLQDKEDLPVVHVAFEDAEAYARWAEKRLPTEAEWEFAARGGLAGALYSWGNELQPERQWMANLWQGEFPIRNTEDDRFSGIAPVGQFPPNGYGLRDMAGNVWEWCADWYRYDYYASLSRAESVARNPAGPNRSFDPQAPEEKKRVHRGGSYLCSDQYCTRYMIGSRGKGEVSSASNHLGFRCVKSAESRRTGDTAPP